MLNFFRKAQIYFVVIIVVMFLFSLQQSFALTVSKMGISSTVIFTSDFMNISGTVIDIENSSNNFFISTTEQHNPQNECCNDDGCHSSCPNVNSFIALIPDVEFDNGFELDRPILYIDLRNNLVLPSALFRPPRTVHS